MNHFKKIAGVLEADVYKRQPGELAEAGAAAVVRTAEELEQFILNH